MGLRPTPNSSPSQLALGPLHNNADGEIRDAAEALGDPLQGLAFSEAGIAGDDGEAALGDQPLDAMGEAFRLGRHPQGFGGAMPAGRGCTSGRRHAGWGQS